MCATCCSASGRKVLEYVRMSLSTGTRSLMFEAATWVGAACFLAAMLANYDTVKSFTLSTLGLPERGQQPLPQQAMIEDHPEQYESSGQVRLRASRHGHFYAEVEINGRDVDTMVDTGASMVALSYEDAERAGIYLNHSDFTHRVNTANGVARVAPVTLERISLGGIRVYDVRAVVSERGRLEKSLLGMSFLSKLDRVDMRSGELILED